MTFDEVIDGLVKQGLSRAKAEAVAGANGVQRTSIASPAAMADRERRLEKIEQRDICKVWKTLRGTVWSTSSIKPANISVGFPDLFLTLPRWPIALWWETKSHTGKPSPEQADFANHVLAAEHRHAVGTFTDFLAYAHTTFPLAWLDELRAAVHIAGLAEWLPAHPALAPVA